MSGFYIGDSFRGYLQGTMPKVFRRDQSPEQAAVEFLTRRYKMPSGVPVTTVTAELNPDKPRGLTVLDLIAYLNTVCNNHNANWVITNRREENGLRVPVIKITATGRHRREIGEELGIYEDFTNVESTFEFVEDGD